LSALRRQKFGYPHASDAQLVVSGIAARIQRIVATLRLRIKTLEERNRELTELLEPAYGVMLRRKSAFQHNFRIRYEGGDCD
jgi:hypothetical protein